MLFMCDYIFGVLIVNLKILYRLRLSNIKLEVFLDVIYILIYEISLE